MWRHHTERGIQLLSEQWAHGKTVLKTLKIALQAWFSHLNVVKLVFSHIFIQLIRQMDGLGSASFGTTWTRKNPPPAAVISVQSQMRTSRLFSVFLTWPCGASFHSTDIKHISLKSLKPQASHRTTYFMPAATVFAPRAVFWTLASLAHSLLASVSTLCEDAFTDLTHCRNNQYLHRIPLKTRK